MERANGDRTWLKPDNVEKVVFLKYNLKAIGYDLITLSDIRLTTLNCHGWCAGSESDTSCSDCDEEKKNNGVTKYLKKSMETVSVIVGCITNMR